MQGQGLFCRAISIPDLIFSRQCKSDESKQNPCARCIRKGLLCEYIAVCDEQTHSIAAKTYDNSAVPSTSTPQLARSTVSPSHPAHAFGCQPAYGISPQNPHYIQAAAPAEPSPFDFYARSNEFHPDPTTHHWGTRATSYHVPSHAHAHIQDSHPPATSSHAMRQMASFMPPPLPITSCGYPAMDGFAPSGWPAAQGLSTYTHLQYVRTINLHCQILMLQIQGMHLLARTVPLWTMRVFFSGGTINGDVKLFRVNMNPFR